MNVGPDVDAALASRFEILDSIGRGTMATVYRGRSLESGEDVAIKVVDLEDPRFDPGERAEQQRRFLQEAGAQRKLNHPNAVRVHDFGHTARHLYLVMELVEGGTLDQRLKSEPMKPLDVLVIARQIAHGLGAAHEQGFVHRDLKPANILLDVSYSPPLAKITDFGLVKDLEDQVSTTKTGQMLGTPLYMAPEQIRGEPVDPRCDIYAFGVLLYLCIAGRPPYEETQTAALLMAHLNQEPQPLPPDIPETLVRTIHRCLAKDREDRFADAAELEVALQHCHRALLSPELDSTLRYRITNEVQPVVPSRKVDWRIALVVLLGLVVTALGVAWLTRATTPPIEPVPIAVPAPIEVPAPVEPEPVVEPAVPEPVAPEPVEVAPAPAPVRPAPIRTPRPTPAPVPVEPEPPEPTPEPASAPRDLDVRQTDLKNPFERR